MEDSSIYIDIVHKLLACERYECYKEVQAQVKVNFKKSQISNRQLSSNNSTGSVPDFKLSEQEITQIQS
jgi:hypothetical protein